MRARLGSTLCRSAAALRGVAQFLFSGLSYVPPSVLSHDQPKRSDSVLPRTISLRPILVPPGPCTALHVATEEEEEVLEPPQVGQSSGAHPSPSL